MSDISIPLSTNYADGDKPNGDTVGKLIYDWETDESLRVINGMIERENFDSSETASPWITRDMLSAHAYFGKPTLSHGAINKDFYKNPWFTDIDLTVDTGLDGYERRMRSIARTGTTVVAQRTPSAIFISWHVLAFMDTTFDPDYASGGQAATQAIGARVSLWANDLRILETDMRLAAGTTTSVGSAVPATPYANIDYTRPDTRQYNGMLIIDSEMIARMDADTTGWTSPLSRGLHSFDLRIAASVDQVRVKSARISAVALYW